MGRDRPVLDKYTCQPAVNDRAKSHRILKFPLSKQKKITSKSNLQAGTNQLPHALPQVSLWRRSASVWVCAAHCIVKHWSATVSRRSMQGEGLIITWWFFIQTLRYWCLTNSNFSMCTVKSHLLACKMAYGSIMAQLQNQITEGASKISESAQ